MVRFELDQILGYDVITLKAEVTHKKLAVHIIVLSMSSTEKDMGTIALKCFLMVFLAFLAPRK